MCDDSSVKDWTRVYLDLKSNKAWLGHHAWLLEVRSQLGFTIPSTTLRTYEILNITKHGGILRYEDELKAFVWRIDKNLINFSKQTWSGYGVLIA